MENYISIEKRLAELTSSGISVRKNNIVCAIFLIIIGIVLFVLGTRSLVESDALNMTLIIFGIGIFIYGIVKICMDLSSVHYFYDQTGQRLKKYKIYVETSGRSTIKSMFDNRDFQAINKIKKATSSGCLLYILMTDNGDCCALQCHDLTMDTFEPTTDVVVLTEAEAKPVFDFIKG